MLSLKIAYKGIGTEMKITPALLDTEEGKVWDIRVIGTADPTALLHAVFSTMIKTSGYMAVWNIIIRRYLS